MKILMVTAETVPFAKTGGLADMVSALAIQLTKMGHDVKIVMPRYYKIDRSKLVKLEGPMAIAAGTVETWSAVYTTTMPGCEKLSVYFIDHEQCFGRDGGKKKRRPVRNLFRRHAQSPRHNKVPSQFQELETNFLNTDLGSPDCEL